MLLLLFHFYLFALRSHLGAILIVLVYILRLFSLPLWLEFVGLAQCGFCHRLLCFTVDQIISFDLGMAWYPYYFELDVMFTRDFIDAIEDIFDD